MAQAIIGLGNKCLDVQGGATQNGTPIILHSQHGGLNQQWELTPDGFIVSSLIANKCLDVYGGQAVNGTPIVLFDKHGGQNQKWSLTSDGYIVSALNTNMCLDVQGNVNANGTKIILWQKNNQPNQKWAFKTPIRVRRNFQTLSLAEKQTFIYGLQLLKNNGIINQFTQMHLHAGHSAHGQPAFLPWHREFIFRFEKALQDILGNPNFSLPYWDWSSDASLPNPSGARMWQNDFMGGAGSPINSGPFATWGIGRSLSGPLHNTQQPQHDPRTSYLINLITQNPSYADFWSKLELPHNRVHVWVGGTMGDATTSPDDPCFYLHHCNIDRLWAIWQKKYPNSGYQPVQNLNVAMHPWDTAPNIVTPANVLNHEQKGYTYDTLIENNNGRMLYTERIGAGWRPYFDDIQARVADMRRFVDVDCVWIQNDLHICGITDAGEILHTMINSNDFIQQQFGDIEWHTGDVGKFINVACSNAGGELHVIGITTTGRILHTRRYSNGIWQNNFGDIELATGDVGLLLDVSCAAIGNDLHVIGVTANGSVHHTVRYGNGTWQSGFWDIEYHTGDGGVFTRVGCANVNGNLHVCAINTNGQLRHTQRYSNLQ